MTPHARGQNALGSSGHTRVLINLFAPATLNVVLFRSHISVTNQMVAISFGVLTVAFPYYMLVMVLLLYAVTLS